MKKMIHTFRLSVWLAACVVCVTAQQLTAQDFHLTHYDAAKIYLNPAMTGMFDGRFRIHANYRNQWTAVASRPFQTAALAWDKPIRRYGVGVQLMNNRAGIGNFNVLSLNVSGAYDLQLDDNNEHHVAFGMCAGFTQKSVNFGRLTWNNQYTMSNGGGFDQSLPSGELFAGNEQQYLLDVSAGALYYFAREQSRINPFIGFSAFHLNQPNESFFGRTSRWPIRYVIHAGGRVGINERLTLQPRVLSMWQLNNRELVLGLLANIYLPNSDSYLIAGPTFRTRDAAILELGLKHGEYTYRISYDINVSTLKPASNNRGGIEFSVVYVAKRKSPVVPPNCPRL
ncbi:MAG: PorP/SprF family type IX secretion system membrane protein [Bacteroidia bacterium]|jgi:type IX secretion system PorP/SprF family membrane protein|nr:PorP/SprF family type IX secretion system membrane protein [Bacteroidia bacterium]